MLGYMNLRRQPDKTYKAYWSGTSNPVKIRLTGGDQVNAGNFTSVRTGRDLLRIMIDNGQIVR